MTSTRVAHPTAQSLGDALASADGRRPIKTVTTRNHAPDDATEVEVASKCK
jgi:hypothetical protein